MASFSNLYKNQLQDDTSYNNHTISQELKVLKDRARELLCDIEHFVNSTSNRKGEEMAYFKKEEMGKIVSLRKEKLINNIFVKARFQHYIDKLYKRIKHFNLQKNLEHKSLKSRRQTTTVMPRRSRKNRLNRRRKTTLDYTGEPTTTEKIIIVRKIKKNTRTPRPLKKHNKINQSLQ